jgi:hypothetical protein
MACNRTLFYLSKCLTQELKYERYLEIQVIQLFFVCFIPAFACKIL